MVSFPEKPDTNSPTLGMEMLAGLGRKSEPQTFNRSARESQRLIQLHYHARIFCYAFKKWASN